MDFLPYHYRQTSVAPHRYLETYDDPILRDES
jgi:hypothetical protein